MDDAFRRLVAAGETPDRRLYETAVLATLRDRLRSGDPDLIAFSSMLDAVSTEELTRRDGVRDVTYRLRFVNGRLVARERDGGRDGRRRRSTSARTVPRSRTPIFGTTESSKRRLTALRYAVSAGR